MSASTEPRWIIVETPCFPCKYKVVQEGRHDGNGSSDNNSWTEYFEDEHAASAEARRRNMVWPVACTALTEAVRQEKYDYQVELMHWLAVRRDYPYYNTPEPPCSAWLLQEREWIMALYR